MIRKQISLVQSLSFVLLALVLVPGSAIASTYKVLYRFGAVPDGANPTPGLVIDAEGNIYGTTGYGGTGTGCGTAGCGTVFKLSPNGDGTYTETILFNFPASDGEVPGGLIFDSAGNLYGTAYAGGGGSGLGSVFELTPNSDGTWTYETLFDFPQSVDGDGPSYGLTFDSAGNIYGTTYYGGTDNCGTIYELSPVGDGTWKQTVLYRFQCGLDGSAPNGGLVTDSQGDVYGTALSGGVGNCGGDGCGLVFELAHGSGGGWIHKTLYTFTGGTDGGQPQTGLALNDGILYGTGTYGGDLNCSPNDQGCGVLFQLTQGSDGAWTEIVIHAFTDEIDGTGPRTTLVFDSAGDLCGASQGFGSNNYGDVFEGIPRAGGGWNRRSLHHFGNAPLGADPNSVTLDGNGNIFGTTQGGGITGCAESRYGCGVVFEITP